MMAMLADVAAATGGTLHGPDRSFDRVSTDTRTLQADELFFALRGERFDAGAFVREAAQRGAAGAVVHRREAVDLPQIEVDDTRHALGRWAAHWRSAFDLPVIGVTGSNGKTTVKEMTAAILRASRLAGDDPERVLATTGNLNNDIGLPLTVLKLNSRHAAAVFEMGANHPGEIAALTAIAQPVIGVVTNAGRAHLEGFGSVEGVAQAKGELFAGLPADGVAVINRDDPYFPVWDRLRAQRVRATFGLHPEADFRASEVRQTDTGLQFLLHGIGRPVPVSLPMAGPHNVINAIAAAAAAAAAGVFADAIRSGLEAMRNVPGRMVMREGPRGMQVFDDSYNANPSSVAAAIAFLAAQSGERRLVLGDMGELGNGADKLHAEIGALARTSGIDRIHCIGPMSRSAALAFGAGADIHESVEALCHELELTAHADLKVLVKASRSMRLDRLVDLLCAARGKAEG